MISNAWEVSITIPPPNTSSETAGVLRSELRLAHQLEYAPGPVQQGRAKPPPPLDRPALLRPVLVAAPDVGQVMQPERVDHSRLACEGLAVGLVVVHDQRCYAGAGAPDGPDVGHRGAAGPASAASSRWLKCWLSWPLPTQKTAAAKASAGRP